MPPLAAVALGRLVRGSRPAWALAVVRSFALAWAAVDTLAGEAAATALSGLACVDPRLAAGLRCPGDLAALGVYAMAAIDAWLRRGDLLQGPNSVLSAAAPAADLPRLQAVHFGSAAMGFGDLFVAALVGCLLAADRQRSSDDGHGSASDSGSERSLGRPARGRALVAVLALALRPALLRGRLAAGDRAGRRRPRPGAVETAEWAEIRSGYAVTGPGSSTSGSCPGRT